MKNLLKIYILIITIITVASFAPVTTFALGSCDSQSGKFFTSGSSGSDSTTTCGVYVPLEPNAFVGVGTGSTTSGNPLSDFLTQVFNFGIAIAVTLAFIMMVWGGIEYMTTDSWQGKDNGKKRIGDALWGLGLALVSYTILWTINPCLVDFAGLGNSNKGCNTSNTFLGIPGTSSDVNVPGFSDTYNSQTNTLTGVGTQNATQQTVTNNSPITTPSASPCVAPQIKNLTTGNCD
jgi:hypothetical protein